MSASFSEQNWRERKAYLGHTSEKAFEEYCLREGITYERFGYHEDSMLDYKYLPLYVRIRPDYIAQSGPETFFVEVKGVGKDGIIKLKIESLEGLTYWSLLLPVKIFVYDSSRKRASLTTLDEVKTKFTRIYPERFTSGMKLFYPIPIQEFAWLTL